MLTKPKNSDKKVWW